MRGAGNGEGELLRQVDRGVLLMLLPPPPSMPPVPASQ